MAAKAKVGKKTWDRRPVMLREGAREKKEPYTTRLFPRTKAGLVALATAWACNVNDVIERLVDAEIDRKRAESH